MGFFTELEKTNNETRTENGDIAYRHITRAGEYRRNLEFFGLGGAMRRRTAAAKEMFLKAFKEDEGTAVKNLFYLRDCRGGKGERKLFIKCMELLADERPEKIGSILPYILEYGRGDDLYILLENDSTLDATCSFISEQINAELENLKKGRNISVLAKWLPKPNATAERKRRLARLIAENMNMSEPAYRKMISGLRAHLNLLETSLTTGSYDFDYSSIPSQAMLKHSGLASRFSKHKVNAFKREDADRYKEYILSLKSGKAKVNVTTLNPVQVYKRAFAQRELSQRQWEQIEKRIPMTDKKIIVVRDGSASMIGEPMDVATSLTILASSRLTGEFKDKFITFSHAPKLVDLSGLSTLQAKIGKCMRETDCTNTNIEATYDLILETSKGCKPEDYITDVVVISDMQFDAVSRYGYCNSFVNVATDIASTFQAAKAKFKAAGIPFPVMTYWNVDARSVSFPTDETEGVRLVSGYSDSIYTSLIENGSVDALFFMKEVLKKYDKCAESWVFGF